MLLGMQLQRRGALDYISICTPSRTCLNEALEPLPQGLSPPRNNSGWQQVHPFSIIFPSSYLLISLCLSRAYDCLPSLSSRPISRCCFDRHDDDKYQDKNRHLCFASNEPRSLSPKLQQHPISPTARSRRPADADSVLLTWIAPESRTSFVKQSLQSLPAANVLCYISQYGSYCHRHMQLQ